MRPLRPSRLINRSTARDFARYLAALLCLSSPPLFSAVPVLPNLPGSDPAPPVQWQVDEQGASVAYETRAEKWEAKLDHGPGNGGAIALEYGLLLNSKLGAGTTFRHEGGYSEIVANAVYEHRNNVRFRLAGAQMRTSVGAPYAADAFPFRQNSYLFSAKKYWPVERFVSDLGLALYTISAARSNALTATALPEVAMQHEDDDRPASTADGKVDGFMLNLGLRPTWDSRIELRREFSHFGTLSGKDSSRREFHSTGRLVYQQHFGNCMQFRGSYGAGEDGGRIEIGWAGERWGVSLAHDSGGSATGAAIYVSFSLPVDSNPSQMRHCVRAVDDVPSFAPVMEAALQRPAQLPTEPITAVIAE